MIFPQCGRMTVVPSKHGKEMRGMRLAFAKSIPSFEEMHVRKQ